MAKGAELVYSAALLIESRTEKRFIGLHAWKRQHTAAQRHEDNGRHPARPQHPQPFSSSQHKT